MCNIQHYIIRIGDDLLSRIIWQILHSIISKVRHPLSLKTSALFCLPYPTPTKWKTRQRMCKDWIIHLTFSNVIEQLVHNSIDWKFLQRVQQSDQSLLTFFQYTTIQIFDTGWFLQLIPLVWCQNDEKPTSQPTHLINSPIHLKLCREWNNQVNLCFPSFLCSS